MSIPLDKNVKYCESRYKEWRQPNIGQTSNYSTQKNYNMDLEFPAMMTMNVNCDNRGIVVVKNNGDRDLNMIKYCMKKIKLCITLQDLLRLAYKWFLLLFFFFVINIHSQL